MSKFLETYGIAIFTLVLIAILIAFAGPLGLKIKEYTLEKAEQTEQIGKDEITVATGGTVRPTEPAEAVGHIYCIYYDDGEMTISQNKIEQEAGRTVVKKGFYQRPSDCTSEMTTVRFVGAVKPDNCFCWFSDCTNLTEIKNIENLYTNECEYMDRMFANCKSLISIDIKNFNTENVETMSEMFNGCNSLTSLEFGNNFDTSKVTNIAHMFSNCKSLTSLDLSNFNTSNVIYMNNMFYNCSSLTSLDLSKFDTSNVIAMSKMFYGNHNLTSLTFGNKFNTFNVVTMSTMFCGCRALTSLDLSRFDTSSVTDMSFMFDTCLSLTSLDLSKFDTSNVTNMTYMFAGCSSLQTKDVKVSQATYDKLKTVSNLEITMDKFDIIN